MLEQWLEERRLEERWELLLAEECEVLEEVEGHGGADLGEAPLHFLELVCLLSVESAGSLVAEVD